MRPPLNSASIGALLSNPRVGPRHPPASMPYLSISGKRTGHTRHTRPSSFSGWALWQPRAILVLYIISRCHGPQDEGEGLVSSLSLHLVAIAELAASFIFGTAHIKHNNRSHTFHAKPQELLCLAVARNIARPRLQLKARPRPSGSGFGAVTAAGGPRSSSHHQAPLSIKPPSIRLPVTSRLLHTRMWPRRAVDEGTSKGRVAAVRSLQGICQIERGLGASMKKQEWL